MDYRRVQKLQTPLLLTGVDANFVRAARRRFDGETVVEMNVRDERDGDILLNFTQRVRGLHIRHRDAHDLAARLFERVDLRDGGLGILSVRVAHPAFRQGSVHK